MGLVNDVSNKVKDYLDGDYEVEEVESIPSVENVPFGKKAKKMYVTVFNIDLRKSSELLDIHQRQTSGKIHKAFLTATAMVVKEYGGQIRSFTGDGLQALWLAQYMKEISESVKTAMILSWFLNNKLSPYFEKYSKLDFGIGIDFGLVYILRAGISRDANNNDLIFIGNCINFSVAMSKNTSYPYNIEISNNTYTNLTDEVKYTTKNNQKTDMWERSSVKWKNKTFSTKKTHYHMSLE